jgi:hypothetical protein
LLLLVSVFCASETALAADESPDNNEVVIKYLLLLSIIFLLNACESSLKMEKQGEKMEKFFQSNNNNTAA